MDTAVNKITKLEEKFREAYMEYYYHFHKNPEKSYEEKETSAYVAEKLQKLPMDEVKTNIGGYGVVGVLKGGKPGPCVGLRADMDALSVLEATGVDFASCNPGVMHACGHDAHTAMLLGVAHVLCEIKDEVPGTVKFVFQPSEEMTPRGGAPGMIEDGVLENPRVDVMLASHVWPTFETGMIGAQDGIVSAASDHLKIKVTGKSAHASMPHEGVDAIVAGAAVVGGLQTIVARNIDPKETAVITIGLINGGTRYNVLPEECFLEGTVRSFNKNVTAQMPVLIQRVVDGVSAGYGTTGEVDYESGYPSVQNNPAVAKICRSAIAEVVGEDGVLPVQGVPAAGEDFSFFSLAAPSVFAWLGCRPKDIPLEQMPPLHNAKFLPDPEALQIGVRYMATAAMKVLSEYIPEKK
ncbi:amidohydrolase [Synergistaceae bacterium OttesenSCG-928-D05]|nr:amidohydrolase [Synergistaceae bacterium OttesenSCG-928-D05]